MYINPWWCWKDWEYKTNPIDLVSSWIQLQGEGLFKSLSFDKLPGSSVYCDQQDFSSSEPPELGIATESKRTCYVLSNSKSLYNKTVTKQTNVLMTLN